MYAENSVCFRKHEICGYECHDGGIDFGGGCTDLPMDVRWAEGVVAL